VPALVSNVVRNTALHLGTSSRSLNAALQSGIERFHALLGLGVNDPRTTWGGTEFRVRELRIHEDGAGNPLHLLLMLPGLLAALAWRRLGLSKDSVKYLVAVVFAFLLFCFYLRWQPWHSRLHLPLFVLWSPLVAVALGAIPQQKLANLVAVLLLLGSWPWIAHNQLRPLIGQKTIWRIERIRQYFAANPALELPYTAAAACVSGQGCKEVGLSLGGDDWEYPVWVLLPGVRLDHVDVKNPSAKLSRTGVAGAEPCAILCLHCSADGAVAYARRFESAFRYGPVYLFIRPPGGSSFSACPPGDVDRGLAQSYAARGQEQVDRGAWDLAAAYYRLAVANWPAWGLAHTKLGNACRALGRLADAEASYRRSIQVEPGYVGAYINLAGLYEQQGRGEEALALYQAAVEADPHSAWAESALGSAYLQRGDGVAALAHLQRAVELEPDNVAWLLALADAYRELNMRDDAAAAYHRVLAVDPGNRRATEALRGLEP